eukprot:3729115-Pleurochrysis_carterae.AAC.1
MCACSLTLAGVNVCTREYATVHACTYASTCVRVASRLERELEVLVLLEKGGVVEDELRRDDAQLEDLV